jgi:hypothetical protein
VDGRQVSDRFLNDFRRTMGDLAIANHYQLFRDGAHRHRLLIHPESGGPHAVPIDAQQRLGFDDAPAETAGAGKGRAIWMSPFRVDVADAPRPADNRLEVDAGNFWPNRIIGDSIPAGGRTCHPDQHPQADPRDTADRVRPARPRDALRGSRHRAEGLTVKGRNKCSG